MQNYDLLGEFSWWVMLHGSPERKVPPERMSLLSKYVIENGHPFLINPLSPLSLDRLNH